MDDTLFTIIGIVVCLIGLVALILGAINLFSQAARQGFVGMAAYVACWVFLAPVTATISVLIGLYLLFLIIKSRFV